MTDIQMKRVINEEIRNKWKFIVLVGIAFACLFMIGRNLEGNFVIQSGDIIVTKILTNENKKDKMDYLKYNEYITATTNIMNFYKQTEKQIDYEKLSPGWGRKSDFQKDEWLRKHFKVFYFGNGKLEIQFKIMQSEPKNLNYIKERGGYILDSWINYINHLDAENHFKIERSFISMPQEVTVSKNRILFKYGLIGFFMGEILALLFIALNGVRKNYGRVL